MPPKTTPDDLQQKVALVTGAGRGIGAALAMRLAKDGMHVVLTARTASELEAVEEAIFEAGGNATIAPLDLTESDSIARLATAIAQRWNRLDLLVLNAAMLGNLSPVTAIDGKELNKLLTLNIVAQQSLIANFDPLLRRSDAGRLIALTSSVGQTPRPYWGAYGASKAALEVLVQAYAQEVKRLSPIRAAIIDPGATRTKMRENAYPGEDPETVKPPEVVADAVAALLASGFETGHRMRVEG
ncbi:SDR family NAD(P)-dependent oxidoreductase [Novosphingopyxis sp.]|uniref:SDR family NAD(P)-dependent oxidoreductase n=1 Tax=Novosphingopyxis sp. TaxID=2709690 RepID=UPI003B594C1F